MMRGILQFGMFRIGWVVTLVVAATAPMAAHAEETRAARCGNGVLEASETCESCPADCAARACVAAKPPRPVSVQFSAPPGQEISGVTLLLSYRSDVVTLPGHGADSSVRERFGDTPENAIVAVNDLDYAARVVVARSQPIPSGKLLSVQFDSCKGASAPSASDFACVVEGCATSFNQVAECRCTVLTE